MGTVASTSTDSVGHVVKTVRFRRDRASKACEVCHTRKVRCDMTENFPCTNCRAFSLVCTPRKGRGKMRKGDPNSVTNAIAAKPPNAATPADANNPFGAMVKNGLDGNSGAHPGGQAFTPPSGNDFVYYPTGVPLDISAGESKRTNRNGENVIVQPSLLVKSSREGAYYNSELPEDEMVSEVLRECTSRVFLPVCDADYFAAKAYGSFLTPTPELSDHLIELYFTSVHPTIPVLNRREFLEQYREDRDKPSLLLRQAIWCVASRMSDHPGVIDDTGSSRRTSSVFYRRAKALFDVNYERTQETLICAAIIMSLAVSNPLYFNHSSFYWIHLATTLAQSIGLHRRLPKYTLDEQRMQRRIWWTIYRRDIGSSMAYGRPNMIRLEDCDVAMVTADDFIGSETSPDATELDPKSEAGLHVAYFLQSVRLHEILALVIRLQFTVSAEWLRQLNKVPDGTHCASALAEWVSQIPPELRYSARHSSTATNEGYNFFRSLLHLEYYTVISLSHRQHIALLFKGKGDRETQRSAAVAFQATHMILKIMVNFKEHGEIRKLPGSCVYTLFCAVFMLSFQRRLGPPGSSVHKAVTEGLNTFREISQELAKTHSAASWVALLADDLQSEKLSHRIAKSMQRVKVDDSLAKSGRVDDHDNSIGAPVQPGVGNFMSGYMSGYVSGYAYGSGSTNGSVNASVVNSRAPTPSQRHLADEPVLRNGENHVQRNAGHPEIFNASSKVVPQQTPATPNSLQAMTPTLQVATPNFDKVAFSQSHPESNAGFGTHSTETSSGSPDLGFPDPAHMSFDLFPPEQILNSSTPDFPTNLAAEFAAELGEDVVGSASSSDEAVPDTMSMADWYAFLNNGMQVNEMGTTELGDLAM